MNHPMQNGYLLLAGTAEFMQRGGQLDHDPVWSAVGMDEEHREFRRGLLREEIKEYFDAEAWDDPVEILDGLLDIIVIAWGTALSYFGVDATAKAAEEVFKSNLAKVIGPGLPIFREDGKILKPEGWEPPNIRKILDEEGQI